MAMMMTMMMNFFNQGIAFVLLILDNIKTYFPLKFL